MIPLSHWLADEPRREFPVSGSRDISAAKTQECDHTSLPDTDVLLAEAHETGRRRALAELAKEIADARSAERSVWEEAMRCEELKWSERFARLSEENLQRLKEQLKNWLSDAVTQVLSPFVEAQINDKAVKELLLLLDGAISNPTDAILEIRAPEALHDRITNLLNMKGLAASLADSETVEIIARNETKIFESMAARWIEELRSRLP